MSRLFFIPQAVRINSIGVPFASAKANWYLTGTTTRTDTYTNNARSVAHANPVIANSAGQFAAIYLDPAITYRLILTESDNTQIDDVDPVHVPFTASEIAVVDAGGNYDGTDVETVLTDLGDNYAKKSTTGTWSADQTFSSADILMADNVIKRPEIKDFSITHTVITSSSNAIIADVSTGNSFFHLLTENTTFTLSNPSPTGKLCQIIIRIKQDGAGGAHTVAWPASVKWAGGSIPTASVSNDAVCQFTRTYDDAGTSGWG